MTPGSPTLEFRRHAELLPEDDVDRLVESVATLLVSFLRAGGTVPGASQVDPHPELLLAAPPLPQGGADVA